MYYAELRGPVTGDGLGPANGLRNRVLDDYAPALYLEIAAGTPSQVVVAIADAAFALLDADAAYVILTSQQLYEDGA